MLIDCGRGSARLEPAQTGTGLIIKVDFPVGGHS